MTENVMMVIVGLVLLFLSFSVTGVPRSPMPPFAEIQPPNMGTRVVLLVFGLVFVGLGAYRLVAG